MTPFLLLGIIIVYFAALITSSIITSKGADTDTFCTANRQSPWYLVAFGMIGASLSGVTFVSVPGRVCKIGFEYFQVTLGRLVISRTIRPDSVYFVAAEGKDTSLFQMHSL